MNKERLLFLAKRLRENAADPYGAKFNLGMWFTKYEPTNPISCGTTACAFGFASMLPEFQAEGLGNNNGCQPYVEIRDIKTLSEEQAEFIVTRYGKTILRGFRAADYFFGLTYREAQYLFDPDLYPDDEHQGAAGEIAVANRIEMLVMGKGVGCPF